MAVGIQAARNRDRVPGAGRQSTSILIPGIPDRTFRYSVARLIRQVTPCVCVGIGHRTGGEILSVSSRPGTSRLAPVVVIAGVV